MAKSNSDMKSIRKKLLAAIAMVLVASVMVVSSSYAWFTLSTAPEVKGITTSVGANGNLEMALRENTSTWPTTGTKNSNNFPNSNKYWGNLVDLSSNEHYHLDQIALRPARLNAQRDEENSKKDSNGAYIVNAYEFATGGYLKTPVYGTDGRLSTLSASNVINGVYNTSQNAFVEDTTQTVRGVRPVGTTSSLSPDELKLRNAKQAVNAAIADSESNATISLRDDSVKLANIVVINQMTPGTTFGTAEKQDVQAAINHLTAIVEQLEGSLRQAVVAVGVAQNLGFEASAVNFGENAITVTGQDSFAWSNTADDEIPNFDLTAREAELLAAYKDVQAMANELAGAQTELDKITKTSDITFAEISAPLLKMLSTQHFDVIDRSSGTKYTVDEFKNQGIVNMAKIMLNTPTISIKGGIYQGIAKFIGNYSATTSMVIDGTFESIKLTNETITVVMATAATEPYYLPTIQNWMSGLTANSTGAAALLTDIYGYAVDLAFRTNASGSSLLLQTEAANRVDDDTLTQGAGSYMEFKSGHADFSLQQVAQLMSYIRVVFMDDNGRIYAVAALDTELESVYTDDTNSTRKQADATSLFTQTDTDGKTYEMTLANATVTQDNTAIKAPLELYNFTVDPTSGVLTLTGKKSDGVITSLVQNVDTGITALVYLDGDKVENQHVAIAGNSMAGSMNLQFASSATLDPMDYTFTAEQLPKPSISITDNTLTITADDKATSFDLYVGDRAVATDLTSETYDLSGLSAYDDIGVGPYQISVVAKATGYTASEKSNVVEYTVATT